MGWRFLIGPYQCCIIGKSEVRLCVMILEYMSLLIDGWETIILDSLTIFFRPHSYYFSVTKQLTTERTICFMSAWMARWYAFSDMLVWILFLIRCWNTQVDGDRFWARVCVDLTYETTVSCLHITTIQTFILQINLQTTFMFWHRQLKTSSTPRPNHTKTCFYSWL